MTGTAFWSIGQLPALRKKIIFTASMIAVYRIGIFVSIPGVDRVALGQAFAKLGGTLFGFFNMFSGGAFEQASIFALGIMPYISASIIVQLLHEMVPDLKRLKQEGEAGRKRINQYTRYGTIVLAVVQGYGISNFLVSGVSGYQVVSDPSAVFFFCTILTLTAGTTFVMWLGEQITERGIGNGISLLIFSGIVAALPQGIFQTIHYVRSEILQPLTILFIVLIIFAVISVIIFFEQAQRRIPVQYAKRMAGRQIIGGGSSHLPLKINSAGVIPPIFAGTFLMLPATIGNFFSGGFLGKLQDFLTFDAWSYNTIYVILIIFFCYFYTAITSNPIEIADNLKRNGAYIPGIRPGKSTADYIDHVLSRITFGGALYLSAICVLPTILVAKFDVPFRFGGTGLLIVVSVALDTVRQIEAHAITQQYEGFTGQIGRRIRAHA